MAALVLIGAVWGLRAYGAKSKWLAWSRTDKGGVALVFMTGLAGMCANSLAAGKKIDSELLGHAVQVSLQAAGGWAAFRKLFMSGNDAKPAEAPKAEPAKVEDRVTVSPTEPPKAV